jgi:hypothetical protein
MLEHYPDRADETIALLEKAFSTKENSECKDAIINSIKVLQGK